MFNYGSLLYISASNFTFLNSISSNIIELHVRHFPVYHQNSKNLINTILKFLVPLSIKQGKVL